MAFVTQIEIDGPRNTVAKTTGDAVAAVAGQVLLDPATLTDMNPGMSGSHLATLLRLDQIDYSIADGYIVQLFWDASTPVLICELYGRGKLEMKKYGGWQNNAGAGVTGKITMTVISTAASFPTTSYSILLVLQTVKFRPISVGGA